MDEATAAFAALVLDDEAAQARLGGIEDVDAFVAAAIDLAAVGGIALGEAAVRATLMPHPPGMARFMPAPVTLDRWPGRGWLPARSVPTGGMPAFDWLWFGDDPLADPFFEEAVRRVERRPFNRMFLTRTDAAALVAGTPVNAPEPAGLVHHMSRCGSTLVAQMLGADPRHVVLSEPEPLDAVVRWAVETAPPDEQAIAMLRSIVAALGRDRTGTTVRRFVKHDSWHTAALPLLRAAFPDTPWAFLYREGAAVLVSQMERRGIHTVPGMLPAAFVPFAQTEAMAAERYAALSLATVVEAALTHRAVGGGLAVAYPDLPGAVPARIAPHFGFRPDGKARAAMLRIAERDAKAPERTFTSDTTAKRRATTPAIADAARDLLDPLHARLDDWRAEHTVD